MKCIWICNVYIQHFQAFLTRAAFPSSGDIAPMEASHSLRPMKSLAPPGLIAAGRVWMAWGGLRSGWFGRDMRAKNLHFCKIAFGAVEIVSHFCITPVHWSQGIPWLDYGPGCMPVTGSPRPCGENGWQRPPSPLPIGSSARMRWDGTNNGSFLRVGLRSTGTCTQCK